jgi:hypothetical protein
MTVCMHTTYVCMYVCTYIYIYMYIYIYIYIHSSQEDTCLYTHASCIMMTTAASVLPWTLKHIYTHVCAHVHTSVTRLGLMRKTCRKLLNHYTGTRRWAYPRGSRRERAKVLVQLTGNVSVVKLPPFGCAFSEVLCTCVCVCAYVCISVLCPCMFACMHAHKSDACTESRAPLHGIMVTLSVCSCALSSMSVCLADMG